MHSPSPQAGIDWAPLRTALAAGDFRAADDEHRARLIELAGPGAVARGWVYFSEVKAMPAADLRVMDGLWRAASGGKFGFAAQREVRRGREERRERDDGGERDGNPPRPRPPPPPDPHLTPHPSPSHLSLLSQVWLQNRRRWDKFFKQIDWVVGEDNNYR